MGSASEQNDVAQFLDELSDANRGLMDLITHNEVSAASRHNEERTTCPVEKTGALIPVRHKFFGTTVKPDTLELSASDPW